MQLDRGGLERMGGRVWQAVRLAVVRLRFVGLVGVAMVGAARLDDLSALARGLSGGSGPMAAPVPASRYACPMHPRAVRTAPGACPACGMPLQRVEEDGAPRQAMTGERLRLGGLAFATAERRPLEREVTALATLEFDERRLARLSTPVRARVLAVHVGAPGTPVRRGEVLATLSARELTQLGRDLQRGLPPEDATVVLARQRLLQLGLSEAQLDRLARGHDPTAFDLLSPLDGVLVGKTVIAGDQVPELTALFTVADVSRLWLVTRLPEADALVARPGDLVEAELLAEPGQLVSGRLTWLDAAIDPLTRTLAARAEVDNPLGRLRTGMSGRARLRLPVGADGELPLLVPATAVVDTGLHQLVWREGEQGVLEATEVRISARVGQVYAVSAGLEAGDRVVAQGAFLLSADQRLRAAPEPPRRTEPARDGGDTG
jgi:Cu(I)/Ag(I) efflux system membrane fusion protein